MLKSAVFVIAVAVFAVVAASKPCLPDEWQANARDTRMRLSVVALSYNQSVFGMKRPPTNKLVKQYNKGLRFDITPEGCDVYPLSSKTIDFPKCVPDAALNVSTSHGPAWEFKNVDGATLQYSIDSPSRVYKKISPDGQESVEYYEFASAVTDPNIFLIPDRCQQ